VNFPPDDVRAQLERILASPGFANAERASRFLRYVVERTMAGEGDQLKEYVIGRAVFDRGDDYDPRIDSIVRVEAGRLRSKIDEYYSGPGRSDGILISLRRGSYAPAFESSAQAASSDAVAVKDNENDAAPAETRVSRSRSRSRLRLGLGLVAAGAVIVLLAWGAGLWATPEPAPPAETIAVLPFRNYSTHPAERLLAARVTDGITSELARLETVSVVSHTTALQYADARPPLREIAKALNAQFVLEGKVRDEAGHINIQVVLVNASTDRKVWVHDVAGTVSEIPEMQRQIAKAASAAVLQHAK
jgi:TolB-like protein